MEAITTKTLMRKENCLRDSKCHKILMVQRPISKLHFGKKTKKHYEKTAIKEKELKNDEKEPKNDEKEPKNDEKE